jgi:hypothetical protein
VKLTWMRLLTAVTHGSAVEAEMFPQFVAVVGLHGPPDETVAWADIAAGSLIPTADAGFSSCACSSGWWSSESLSC